MSRQQETLVRWLDSRQSEAPTPVAKVKTARQAFAEQGLALLPDPLERFKVSKVVRVADLL